MPSENSAVASNEYEAPEDLVSSGYPEGPGWDGGLVGDPFSPPGSRGDGFAGGGESDLSPPTGDYGAYSFGDYGDGGSWGGGQTGSGESGGQFARGEGGYSGEGGFGGYGGGNGSDQGVVRVLARE
jgi:hypothetical protein